MISTADNAVIQQEAITARFLVIVGGVKCHAITKPGRRESCFLMYIKWNRVDRKGFQLTDDFMFAVCLFTCNWKFSPQIGVDFEAG